MRVLLILLIATVKVLSFELPFSKFFFPGNPPKLVPGIMQIQGHYLESELSPMIVPPNVKLDQPIRSNLTKPPANRTAGRGDTQARSGALRRNFGLPPLGQTSTYLYAEPPLCVACACLQGYQSCADAGGVQLVDTNAEYTAGSPALPTFMKDGYTCGEKTEYDYYYYQDRTTVTCIAIPPGTLSACDASCRSLTANCQADPSYDNCPQLAAPAVCGTACADAKIGTPVPCSPTAFGVIAERPTTVCNSLKKREANERSAPIVSTTPRLEPSIGRPKHSAGGRAFIAAVITKRYPGKVTATYVATEGAACLPSNILASPNCK